MKAFPCLLAAASLLLGCKPTAETKTAEASLVAVPATKPAPPAPKEREISGTIFIATKGGQNVMLGSVTVHVAEWKDAQRQLESDREVCLKLAAERAAEALAFHTQASNAVARATTTTTALATANGNLAGVGAAARDQALAPFQERALTAIREATEWQDKAATKFDDRDLFERWATTGEQAFEDGPTTGRISSGSSDSRGNYRVKVPNDRQVVLVAVAERTVGRRKESYAWCVTIAPSEMGPVHLSNANLLNDAEVLPSPRPLRLPMPMLPELLPSVAPPAMNSGSGLTFSTPTWKVVEKNSSWWKVSFQFTARNNGRARLDKYVTVQVMDGANFELDNTLEKVVLQAGESKAFSGSTLVKVPQAATAKSVRVSER